MAGWPHFGHGGAQNGPPVVMFRCQILLHFTFLCSQRLLDVKFRRTNLLGYLKLSKGFKKNTKKADLTFLNFCDSKFWLRGRPKPQLLLEKKYRKSSIWRLGKEMARLVCRMTFLIIDSSSLKPAKCLSKLV